MTDDDKEENEPKFVLDGIGHLLKDRLFRVPPHQRSYKWDAEEHVRQLFRDVQDAMNGSESYFLGMIVLKSGATKRDRVEIIDGQQRLATVSIFLAAVRDHFLTEKTAEGNDRAQEIQRIYLADRDLRTLESDPRLYLNTEDKDFFSDHIIKGVQIPEFTRRSKHPPSHKRIAEALAQARAQVEAIASAGSPDKSGERLLNWVEYFVDMARVVAIFVPEEQNAYTLFETLNDRGLELTKADLIKNHLFGRCGKRLDEVRQLWTEMTTNLESAGGEEGTVDFIRHYWSSQHQHVRTKGLYLAVKTKTQAAKSAYDTSVSLRDNSRLYAALINPDAKFWKDYSDATQMHVRTLLEVGVSVLRPLALSVLGMFEEKEAATAFQLFVNWSVRFLIAGGHRSEAVEVGFSKTAIEIANSRIKTAPQMSKALVALVPGDDDFQNAFAIATVSKSVLARYYLRAIEDRMASAPHPEWITQPDSSKVNLEHVLPLNPSPGWAITKEEAEPLHNRIGNLALLPSSVNVDIGNKDFDEKKKAFANCGYGFTAWIAGQPKWGEAEISARQSLLAKEAVETWPLRFWR